jgi:hypothetical protein
MIQQCANRSSVTFYFYPVADQDMDKAADVILGLLAFNFPLIQHLLCIHQMHIDHGIQNFILGFKMIVKLPREICTASAMSENEVCSKSRR